MPKMLGVDAQQLQCYSLLNVAHGLVALHYLNGQFGANDSAGDHLDGGHSATDYPAVNLQPLVNHLILLTVGLELLILIKSVGFANLIHFAALRANLGRTLRFMQLLLLSIFTTILLTVLLGATDLR